jgi:hypothetical protein
MGDRRPKDSGGANHRYKHMQGNHEERNQQANLPLFNIEMMSKRKWDNYRFTSRRELHVYSP